MLKRHFDTEELNSLFDALSRDIEHVRNSDDVDDIMCCFGAAIDEICELAYSRILEIANVKMSYISDCWSKVFGEDEVPEKIWEHWDT